MKFTELQIPGVWLIAPEPVSDERGSFSRLNCAEEFASLGLCTSWLQVSESYNIAAGTLRGLHWQDAPHSETKLIRCVHGAIFDVIVDIREKSPTYGRWTSIELNAGTNNQIYIPAGCAHGFQTLSDYTRVTYQISSAYTPASARGIRWNDPALAIVWPIPEPIMSRKDKNLDQFAQ